MRLGTSGAILSSLATLFDSPTDATPEELRAPLRALADLIARAPVAIGIAHDPAARFISANDALARLLGVPATANISLAHELRNPLAPIRNALLVIFVRAPKAP